MNEESIRVSLAFARVNAYLVAGTANTVLSKLYSIPEFENPPVTAVDLQASTLALTTAQAAMVNGGKLATAERDRCLKIVVDQMKKLAYFVQINCDNSLVLLLSSGFEAVSTNRARTPLAKPVIRLADNGMTGQTVLAVTADALARSWQAESALVGEDGVPGTWFSAPPATDSRKIIAVNLQPGSMYAHRVRGVGGSTGCSDWSDTVNHRAA